MKGQRPSKKCVLTGIKRAAEVFDKPGQPCPQTHYAKFGRKEVLTDAQKLQIINFVTKWRNRFFCSSPYIKKELKLQCSRQTINR